jgi:hypothetical protein
MELDLAGTQSLNLGLDSAGQAVVDYRLPIIYGFLSRFSSDPIYGRSIKELQSIIELALANATEQQWRELGLQLGFVQNSLEHLARQHWRVGTFSTAFPGQPGQLKPIYKRPNFDEVVRTLQNIYAVANRRSGWAKAILEYKLCREEHSAGQLARQLEQLDRRIGSSARALIQALIQFDEIGVLLLSSYSYTTELMLLQRYVDDMRPSQIVTDELIIVVRRDILALAHALNGHKPARWDQTLLHQPPQSTLRNQYRQRIAVQLPRVIDELITHHGWSATEALLRLDALIDGGLAGLIAIHSSTSHKHIRQANERLRVEHSIDGIIKTLGILAQARFRERLTHVQAVLEETETPLNLVRLLQELPLCNYRRRIKRQKLPDALVEGFARRAGFTKKSEARSCLENLRTYGPIGLFLMREWKDCFDSRIWSYAEMLKLGRIDGTVEYDALVERVNEYAKALHQPTLPLHFIVPLFTHFKKPRYYNSGEGAAVAGVPRRASLHIQGRLRLHERWLVIASKLKGLITDASLRPELQTLHALLVVDCGSQQPMGCLVVEHPPTATDVGLVLHQSIWHGANLDWPLRGIPETIVVPKDFKCNESQDLRCAAEYLMANLETEANARSELGALPKARAVMQALPIALTEMHMPLTLAQAQTEVLRWLNTTCFPNHIVDRIPKHLRDHDVALPGYDTPAAGWLLPRIEQIKTQRNGIIIGHREYTSPQADIEPGQHAWLRMNPIHQKKVIPYVFVETEQESGAIVQCLFRQSRA